jgi:O-antigen/teichoic acid export membrane protein
LIGAAALTARVGFLAPGRLVHSASIYAASNVLKGAVPFLLLPVLTRYLSPEDFGRVAMFTLAVNIILPLVGLNTEAAIARQYFERDRIDFPGYVTSSLYLVLGCTLLTGGGILLVFGEGLGRVFALSGLWLALALAVAATRSVASIALALWLAENRPIPYAAYSIGQSVLSLGLSATLIVVFGFDWRGRVIGEAVAWAALGLLTLYLFHRWRLLGHGFASEHVRHAVRFGGGLVPHAYGGIFIAGLDRLVITNFVGIRETGLYAVAGQVALILGVLVYSFNQAWIPWLYARLKSGRPADLAGIDRLTRNYGLALFGAALAIGVGAPPLLSVLAGPKYLQAAPMVLWLALANVFEGMYKMTVCQIFYANKTHYVSAITLGTGMANVLLLILLTKHSGAVGAAQATALAQAATFLLTARVSARVVRSLTPRSPAVGD